MQPIAHIASCFPSKFGIPRQAGIVDTPATVIFEPPYRIAEAVRGLEEFDYIWLIWQFHEAIRQDWSPTVRPPRLGGNRRMGVFATRSPFRPNAIGLSSVRLEGTPIFDIKPYLPYTDSHPGARSGFAPLAAERLLTVECPPALLERIPQGQRQSLLDLLSHDPRPQYHHDPQRLYGMAFAGFEIKFKVNQDSLVVSDIVPLA